MVVSFLCVCPVIDHKFYHNIVILAVDSQGQTDLNLFFTITNCQIVRSRSLTHGINYKLVSLSAYRR